MKTIKKLLVACMMLLISISCIHIDNGGWDTPTNKNGEHAILFSRNYGMTKAVTTSVSTTGYDEFALYTWNSNNDTIMNPYMIHADGENSYQYDDVANQELKYFTNTANFYEFLGVIPTDHEMSIANGKVQVNGLKAFAVDDNRVSGTLTADSPEEFLWSYRKVNKSDYASVVELPFEHGNAVIYLGFSSDRDDTVLLDYVPSIPEVPATPDVNDTTDTWFNLKRSSGNVDGSATKTRVKTGDTWGSYVDNYELPAALVAEIKSYYSVDGGAAGDYDLHMGNTVWPSSTIKKLRIVKPIPAAYKISCQIYNTDIVVDFFDGFKYLKDNGYDIQPRNSGGKPAIWDYILIDAFVNGTAYTVVGLDAAGSSYSVPQYTIDVTPGTPAIPGRDAIEGVRLFSADSTDLAYCAHIAHTMTADATISSNGTAYSNRQTSNDVMQFSLPSTTTLSENPVWSPTTFYAIPGDADYNYLVVKLSYIYKGVTAYDVRVPIKLPAGGLQAGKYYKYELYITSTGNGTNDPTEASDEKEEIIIEENPVISVKLIDNGYSEGDNRRITI